MMKNNLKIVQIDENSITPKYIQIKNSILSSIESGQLKKDDILPSINDLSFDLEASRNTVEKAYKKLKQDGIIESVAGKGYFITGKKFNQPIKIMLLFNKLSSHKKIMYDAFAKTLENFAAIDFYIYNNNFNYFKKLLLNKIKSYSKFVIIPHFIESSNRAYEVINCIPKEKLILMDKLEHGVTGKFGAVFEDFENDIYHALEHLLDKLHKYHTLKIIFPEESYYSKDILTGFRSFCRQYAFDYEVISSLKNESLCKNAVYINLEEDDLVELIEKILAMKFKVGKDIGIVSYNETPIKKIILNGITTISTDFKLMGEKAAELVLNNSTEHVAIPFLATSRNSL